MTCIKCGLDLTEDFFYKHAEMKNGHLSKCKDCCREYAITHRRENIERIRMYDNNRDKTESRRAKKRMYEKSHRERNVEKSRARNAVSNALRDGKIVKMPCEVCGNHVVTAHHEDYSQPLRIKWLCRSCHFHAHGKRIDDLWKTKPQQEETNQLVQA